MIYHPDGSVLLHHFIRPDYLVALLECQKIHLKRQDLQSDPFDGVLPSGCTEQPFRSPLEDALGLSDLFLKSQAHAIAAMRSRTFIMSWTVSPSEGARAKYGEGGERCEIRASMAALKRMLGYETLSGNEFPARKPLPEIFGSKATAQLTEPVYTQGTTSIQVVPSFFATAHKHRDFANEEEIRIQVTIPHETPLANPAATHILWPLNSIAGLHIQLTDKTPEAAASRMRELAADLCVEIS
jgi:hypothetical protein